MGFREYVKYVHLMSSKKKVAKVCGSVCGEKACLTIYKDGCLNLNPTTQVANLKMCVNNYKTSVNNGVFNLQMDIKAKACTKVWKWEKCWTFWEKHINYNYSGD